MRKRRFYASLPAKCRRPLLIAWMSPNRQVSWREKCVRHLSMSKALLTAIAWLIARSRVVCPPERLCPSECVISIERRSTYTTHTLFTNKQQTGAITFVYMKKQWCYPLGGRILCWKLLFCIFYTHHMLRYSHYGRFSLLSSTPQS